RGLGERSVPAAEAAELPVFATVVSAQIKAASAEQSAVARPCQRICATVRPTAATVGKNKSAIRADGRRSHTSNAKPGTIGQIHGTASQRMFSSAEKRLRNSWM